MAEPPGEGQKDLDVVAGALGSVEGLAHPLHPPLGVGDGPFGLAPRGSGRKHDVGHLGGLGQKDVLHHQMFETLQAAAGSG